ncbi:MAG: repeat-associated core domain protein [Oscillospiraceae bacterium]|jgi:YD repeat-containing protein|nr:repeat-associated core domain protein [Oscillospiraceae bacterium]
MPYKPDGLRFSKTVGDVTTKHIWDGQNMVAETDGSNVMRMQYLRGVNLLANKAADGTKSYYLYNAHGDVVGLSNGAGEVARKYDYDAFGNEKVLAGQTQPDEPLPLLRRV